MYIDIYSLYIHKTLTSIENIVQIKTKMLTNYKLSTCQLAVMTFSLVKLIIKITYNIFIKNSKIISFTVIVNNFKIIFSIVRL